MTKKFTIKKAWLILDDGNEVEVKPLAENAIPVSECYARGGYGNTKIQLGGVRSGKVSSRI